MMKWMGKVETVLGRKIPDIVWHILEKEGYVIYADRLWDEGEQQEALEHLVEGATEYCKLIDEGAPKLPRMGGQQPKPKRPPKVIGKGISPDKRSRALSEVIAALANREGDIQKFRQDILNGKLLKPEEVPTWVRATRDKEGYTLLVTLRITHGAGWEDCLVQEAQSVATFLKSGESNSAKGFRFKGGSVDLSFANPGSEWVESVPINESGTLGRLKKLSKKYEAFWPEAQAVQFILTGQAYPVSQARIKFNINSYGMDKVALALSPYLTGEEVKSIYLKGKRALLSFRGKGKTRQLYEKNLALAVFAAKVCTTRVGNKRVPVTELVRLWNKQHRHRGKDYVYDKKRSSNFARDCRAAFENLTGWKWEDCFD